ncbi:hypothetical protein CDAR_600741 [Caerostris darwini]|uniref:Uncharacterized protein n=1 Tax=Caerostris darwini TaxID=1538125 RepID=A0AAV4TT32_9ARAC|nr:hypothetical protein CDAR_600741 [Caerostris darwini]
MTVTQCLLFNKEKTLMPYLVGVRLPRQNPHLLMLPHLHGIDDLVVPGGDVGDELLVLGVQPLQPLCFSWRGVQFQTGSGEEREEK